MRLSVFVPLLLAFFVGGAPRPGSAQPASWPAGAPIYDHIVIVVEENKGYDQIIGNLADAPYLNSLASQGASLTAMFAEEHHSQGNYFWLFSGSNQNVGFEDAIPASSNNPNYPFQASNLAQQLIAKGRSFKGYAEGLPAIGSNITTHGHYARKHVPWISFANIPNGSTASTSSNLRFLDFPTEFSELPAVSFVIPHLLHDMHDGAIPDSIRVGDQWLHDKLDPYYRWAQRNNSLLIVTFDEDADESRFSGLTDPSSPDARRRNRIATIFAGAHVKPGRYAEGKGVTHVNILRTLEAMYALSRSGAQQPNAVKAGISDDQIITDLFAKASE
jgi:phosphatidylinositol-3-phosphatase